VRLASIHVYPLKGARGIALARSEVLRAGLRHDRRFMAVSEDGTFLTQRSHPKLALLDVGFEGDTLVLAGHARVPLDGAAYERAPRRRVRVWRDEVDAVDVPGEATAVVSDHLGTSCRVVFLPPASLRSVESPHGRVEDRVGFADAFPVLVASLASLADLNARLTARGAAPVPMDRFRPNLVVEGAEPWEEERHPRTRIGDVALRLPKRCARCSVTTVDQATSAVGKEPLRTLATFRKTGNEVHFAMNAIPDAEGTVAVGDAVSFGP
jgi:uncharacterized protein YcbX